MQTVRLRSDGWIVHGCLRSASRPPSRSAPLNRPRRTPRALSTYLSGAMRFASVLHENTPLAVAIEGDRAVPLRGVTELGA